MNELAIELKSDTGECLYQQIYEYIKQEIRTGKLSQNEKLPSTRSLADYLQVARSTVDAAYGQLLAEGYIEAKPCRGYFICPVEELLELSMEEPKQQSGERNAGWNTESNAGGNIGGNTVRRGEEAGFENVRERSAVEEKSSAVRDLAEVRFDFSPHAISMKQFPFATWKRLTKEILVDANSEMFALGDAQGDYELRETIGRYLHQARGVNCRPEQIIIGAGNDYLLMLLEKILGRHVPIAMENPTYRRAYRVFGSFAYQIETLPVDENGLLVEALKGSRAKVAYVMPSHQYPTGIVMPIRRRLELLKWAEQEPDRYLIEDDYDSEFRYRGKPIPSLQASDRCGKVIYIGTFSKSIAPAIRVGYMVLPEQLLQRYQENCGFYASTVSRIDQRILNEFIRDGYFERYLNKMRKIYRDKHDFLLELLEDFKPCFQLSGENAGLHVLLTPRGNVSEQELLQTAAQRGIRLYGMSENLFDTEKEPGLPDAKYRNTILLGYGALEPEEIRQGITELKEAWRGILEG